MKTSLIEPNKETWEWFHDLCFEYSWDAYLGNEPAPIHAYDLEEWRTYYGDAFFDDDGRMYHAFVRLNKEVTIHFILDTVYVQYNPYNGNLDTYEWASDDKTYHSEHRHTATQEHDLSKENVNKVLTMVGKRDDVLSKRLFTILQEAILKYGLEHKDWR